MRRIRGLVIACGLLAACSSSARAQAFIGGDVAGFGPNGISNGFGYGIRQPPDPSGRFGPRMANLAERMNRLGMQGYWTPLYFSSDFGTGPSPYYQSSWSGINGTPRPDVAARGWGYSPPWSADYRQGLPPRKHKLFARLHQGD